MMKIIISPAKSLDFETPSKINNFTMPAFLDESCILMNELKQLSPQELSTLMKISPKLGELNYVRNQSWRIPFNLKNAKQSIFAFRGDVYAGLDVDTLDKQDLTFAQKHLHILSGLYGILKPLDLIQPYRLEMGTKLTNQRGKDLYQFWGEKLTTSLQKASGKNQSLINLASIEYSKAIQFDHLNGKIITPIFKDKKNGSYKLISFFAKKARGLMCRYIIQNQITDPELIKDFNLSGYHFNAVLSNANEWVFTRNKVF